MCQDIALVQRCLEYLVKYNPYYEDIQLPRDDFSWAERGRELNATLSSRIDKTLRITNVQSLAIDKRIEEDLVNPFVNHVDMDGLIECKENMSSPHDNFPQSVLNGYVNYQLK